MFLYKQSALICMTIAGFATKNLNLFRKEFNFPLLWYAILEGQNGKSKYKYLTHLQHQNFLLFINIIFGLLQKRFENCIKIDFYFCL